MKKLAVIFFSLFYLIVTIGLAVDVQYCDGEVKSVQFYNTDNSCCCGDNIDEISCCSRHIQFIKFEKQQTIASNFNLNKIYPELHYLVSSNQDNQTILYQQQTTFSLPIVKERPPEIPSWLLFCSLVYYG